jgi:ElaB/YqjD/DUF883 family membrane-anchored ribosome-binding protein
MHRFTVVTIVMIALLISITGVAGAQSQASFKLADKLMNKSQAMTSAIRSTNLQVKKTLEHYNYIIQGKASDPRKEYKSLQKDLDKTLKERENVRVKAESMQKAADNYFASWEASQAGYTDADLRAKSEARLAETKDNYSKIFEAGRKAAADFDGFIAKMDDQIRFLGQDLNPAAIADLSDEAAGLNKQADGFFKSITETLKTANDYTNSLKPQ